MNFRLQIAAALTFTLLMFGWAPAEPIQFQSLPTNPAVTTMSLSEDGRFLIVAHEMANQISIWDAQTAKHIKVIATPRPSFVLSRSKRVYVANNTKGTISLFAIDKDWEFTDQLQVGQNNIRSLSAPLGKNFEGVIFATCPEDQPSPKAQIVAIDTVKDRSAPIFPPAACEAVTVDSLGRFFVQQIPFDYSPSGKVDRALDLKMALAGRRKEIGGRPDHREAPYLRPFGPTGLWFGGNVVFGGMPPNSSQKTWGNVVLPDLLMPMFYAIGDTSVKCVSLNAQFTVIGTRDSTYPKGFFPKAANWKLRVKNSRRTKNAVPLFQNFAVTKGDRLSLFLIDPVGETLYYALTTPFAVASADVAAGSGGGFPIRIEAGKKFTFQFLKQGQVGEFNLMTGPRTMALSAQGQLAWTPTSRDIGKHPLKIRARIDGKVNFLRYELEVVGKGLPAIAENALPSVGPAVHVLQMEKSFDLLPSRDRKSVYILNGSDLRILDQSGQREVAAHKLAKPYKRICDRGEYLVALSDNSVDLLDKNAFKVIKSIELMCTSTRDLAIHPKSKICYATVQNTDGGRRGPLTSSRVVLIDEARGLATELDKIYGNWVSVDPTGSNFYVALRAKFQQGLRIDWNIGQVFPEYGEIDILVRYEIRGRTLRHMESNLEAGTNGKHMIIAPDGKQIAYVSGAGTPKYSYAIPAYKASGIKGISASYKVGAYPQDISFHPQLNLVVASNGKEAVLFNRETGEKLADRFTQKKERGRGEIKRVFFSPSGTNVLVVYGETYKGFSELRSFPLDLTPQERELVAKGFTPPKVVVRPDDGNIGAPKPKPVRPLSLHHFESLTGRAAQRKVSAKEIAGQYTGSVVLIESEDGIGSGFVIGSKGYILTCAHVLPLIGDASVKYQARLDGKLTTVTTTAEVLRVDRERDLAVLRIKPLVPLLPVQFNMGNRVQAGEEVTIIGNPTLGRTVLTNTVTTGVVSNAQQSLDGATYIQTSAATNPGNSGGPMFNERGIVIGVVVSKARLENTGFAVPIGEVLKFLGASPDKPEALTQSLRTWTDVTGQFRIKATLVQKVGNIVRLKKESGEVIAIPLNKLSEQDRRLIETNQTTEKK